MQQTNAFNPSYNKYQPSIQNGSQPAPMLINQVYPGPSTTLDYATREDDLYNGQDASQTFPIGQANYDNQFHNMEPYQALNDGSQAQFYHSGGNHQNVLVQQQQADVGEAYEMNQSNFHNGGVTFQTTQQIHPQYGTGPSLDFTQRRSALKMHAPQAIQSQSQPQPQQQPPPPQQQYCMPMTIAPRQRQLQQQQQQLHYYADPSGYVGHNTLNGFAGNFPASPRQVNDEYAQYRRQGTSLASNNFPSHNARSTTTTTQGVQPYGHAETHQDCNSLSTYDPNVSLINDNNGAQIYPMPSVVNDDMVTTNATVQAYHSNQVDPCQFIVHDNPNQTVMPSQSCAIVDSSNQQQVASNTTLGDNLPIDSNEGDIIVQTSGANLKRQAQVPRYPSRPSHPMNGLQRNRDEFELMVTGDNNASLMNLTPSPNNQRSLAHKQVTRNTNQQDYIDMRSSGNLSQEWLDTICRHMIEHMNSFGICVIDNFLGSIKGELILSEVKQLFSNRSYTTGKLVSDKLERGPNETAGAGQARENKSQTKQPSVDPARAIRNDRVIWVDGCEEGCEEINNLIQTLCSVITNSSRLSLYSNNGLDTVVINKRTKAHVACYPGNGTRYIKHVDNPNGDGRVITAIYYLNKSWDTNKDGGLLRMFPTGVDTVANIEPLFDRVLFFWSDRRNPHEVLPAYRDRFAITVWYIGESRALET